MTTIHLVSHTHWDREWYLTFQQFRYKFVKLMDHLLDILENENGYNYFLLDGQTILLEDYLQIRPERELDLIKYIRNGQLLIGPWYVSPDEFLLAPESHIRNLLAGDKLCTKFGGKMPVGYLPDTFGHIGQMPQILQGFGIKTACVWRGLGDQGCELNWKSPDGSTVLMAYMRESYSNASNLTTSDISKFTKEVSEDSLSLSQYSITGNILLMNGTDHMEPSKDLAQCIYYYQGNIQENKLIHSSLPLYFDSVQSNLDSSPLQLPVITGELRSSKHTALLQSVLSTRINLKQRNHVCENDLLKWVEPLNIFNHFLKNTRNEPNLNNNYTSENRVNQNPFINYVWKLLMQCHPHDSICGTSIDQVAEEVLIRFDQVDQINSELINQNVKEICDQIDTRFTSNSNYAGTEKNILGAIIIFNPNDLAQTGLINLNIMVENQNSSFDIVDGSGKSIPFAQEGTWRRELISMKIDKKGMKQALGMIHEGKIAGFVIRDFEIERYEQQAIIRATLSNHAQVEINKWMLGLSSLEGLIADSDVNEYIIHAYSDPEINVSLVAQDVPGHGYLSYWMCGNKAQNFNNSEPIEINPIIQHLMPVINQLSHLPFANKLIKDNKNKSSKSPYIIENEYFYVEAIPHDGTISVTDKITKSIYKGLNRFIDRVDRGDLYNYCPLEQDIDIKSKFNGIEIDKEETYQKIILHLILTLPTRLLEDRKSRSRDTKTINIKSTIILVPGVPRIDIHTEVDNLASDHRLRVHFPVPFSCTNSFHDGHFAIVDRPSETPQYDETWEEPPRPEVPQCLFTSITNDLLSLTISNQGLPEVEVINNENGSAEIALTLLRCVGWLSRDDLQTRKGHAGPMDVSTPEAQMIGNLSFDYSIIPGDKNWRKSTFQAYAFNSPLKVYNTTIHNGILPNKSTFIENDNQDFVITAIKQSEDNSGLVVRGFNALSSPIDVSIKTWRMFNLAQLVSLNEKPVTPLSISSPGLVNIHVEGYKIATVRFYD